VRSSTARPRDVRGIGARRAVEDDGLFAFVEQEGRAASVEAMRVVVDADARCPFGAPLSICRNMSSCSSFAVIEVT
jgi:hypothetical protein